jgi:hypothetical protein
MPVRRSMLLLLSVAACAAPRPPPAQRLADLPPLPRSSLVAVLAHRNELQLTDQQSARLEQADAELQRVLERLRAEGGSSQPPGGAAHRGGHGGPPADPPGGQRPTGGYGPGGGGGGFQLGPAGGGGGRHGGGGPEGARGGAAGGPPRRDPARALETRLDDADTDAFLKAETIFTEAQRDRAREIAERHREQVFERRELLRGR